METIERDHPQFVEPLLLRDVYGMSYEEIADAGRRPARHRQGPDPPRPQARPAAAARALSEDPPAGVALGALVLLAACTSEERRVRLARLPRPRPSVDRLRRGGRADRRRAGAPRSRTGSTPTSAIPGSTPCTTSSTSTGTRRTRLLTGRETLTLRATEDADHLQLDLSADLTVDAVTVGGEPGRLRARRQGPGDLPGRAGRPPLRPGHRLLRDPGAGARAHQAQATSTPPAGRPPRTARSGRCRSRTAPTRWYAVNDQPSDKALYTFTDLAPRAVGRRRQRRARLAHHPPRPDPDPLGARRAGGVVPRHHRDRRPGDDRGPLALRGPDHLLDAPRPTGPGHGRSARRPPGWPGSRTGSGPTPSTRSASCSSTPRAAWRPRR